jgi:hypothetical protein
MAEYDKLGDRDSFLVEKSIYGIIIGPSNHAKILASYAHDLLEPLIGRDLTFYSIHEVDDYVVSDSPKHVMLFEVECITENPIPKVGLVLRDGEFQLQIVNMFDIVISALKTLDIEQK